MEDLAAGCAGDERRAGGALVLCGGVDGVDERRVEGDVDALGRVLWKDEGDPDELGDPAKLPVGGIGADRVCGAWAGKGKVVLPEAGGGNSSASAPCWMASSTVSPAEMHPGTSGKLTP